jgi:hypothetical protein
MKMKKSFCRNTAPPSKPPSLESDVDRRIIKSVLLS